MALNEPIGDTNEPRAFGSALQPAAQAVSAVRDPYRPMGGYGAGDISEETFGTTLLGYWRTIVKRRWLILSCVTVAVALGGLRTLMTTPLYTATIRLQIDQSAAKVVESGNISPTEQGDSEFLRTQYELLQSRSIAERAVISLRLVDDADFLQPRSFSLMGMIRGLFVAGASKAPDQESRERAMVQTVLASRSIRPLPGSRLADVSYSDPSPVRAQRIVTALADGYITSNIDKRFEANSYAKTFLEDQTKQLKIRLEESEKSLLDFAQREQIVAVTEKSSSAESNLAAANAALGVLVSERIKNEQLWRQVEKANSINLPQLLTNTVIDGLRGRKNTLTTDYQEKLETFKPDYPGMVQIKNKIGEIDRQLANEVKTIKESYKAAYESALKQETEMKQRIDELKGVALDLQQRSIQYNILKREVDTNRGLYEGLLQRYKQVDIAGGSGANNVFVIDKAEIPQSPSSPILSQALLLFLGLGLGSGLGLAFLIELLDDTIRSVEQLERVGGLVTLGVIPKLSDGRAIESELEDGRSVTSESYRSLCTALQFSTETGLPKSIVVTSTIASEGKSSTAIAIARHFAGLGLKVLLIDADLRKPTLHQKLKLENGVGLSNALTGACQVNDAVIWSTVPNLAIMTSGPLPPNSAELLGGARATSLLTLCCEMFNLVVVDSAPVLGLADAPLLSSIVGGTVFVIGAGQTKVRGLRDALRRLQMARGQILGVVLTWYDAKAAGHAYGYGYGAEYGGYGYGNRATDTPVSLQSEDAKTRPAHNGAV